ncbi:MAG: hypothetical protein LC769_08690 [Chloroflexi bacterium]|nr:hypothetical protein [Chloroflexota bacterium]
MSDYLTADTVRVRTSQPVEDVSRADVMAERAGRLQAEARAAAAEERARAAEERARAAEERAAVADWLVAVLRSELIGSEQQRHRWWCPWSRRAQLWYRREGAYKDDKERDVQWKDE